MKRRVLLFGSIFVLAVLTACGSDENPDQKETQAEYRMSEEDAEREANGDLNGEDVLLEYEYSGGDETLTGYEYEADIIRYGELSERFSFRKDVERTVTDYAVYYFESSISERERQACITATDRALSCIGAALPEIEIAVFTNETFDAVAVSGNRLYTSIRPWDSAEYLAGVLLAGYGEWGNYGMASYEELVQDWNTYINENYSWYSGG